MVEPPMPPGPVDDAESSGRDPDDDDARRERAAVEPGDPVPDDENP